MFGPLLTVGGECLESTGKKKLNVNHFKIAPLASLSLCGLILSSCSSPEDVAMARAKSRAKPSYVRVLNLSGCDAHLEDRGRQIVPTVPSAEVTTFASVASGQPKLDVKGGCVDVPVAEEVKPTEAGTIIVGPNGKLKTWVGDELRFPSSTANFRAVFVDSTGALLATPPKLDLKYGSQSLPFDGTHLELMLDQGSWQCASPLLDAQVSVDVEPKNSYTLFLVKLPNGKLHGTAVKNTPILKPMGGSASAA